MIFWYTDNNISKIVAEAVTATGHKAMHISKFDSTPLQPSIFYGIMRGTGRAMHILKHHKIDYWYLDNGYFDAQYVDSDMKKHMNGTYRIVRNDMMEQYVGEKPVTITPKIGKCVVIPPTIYTANHYNTTPEDWLATLLPIQTMGYEILVRDKKSETSLDDDLMGATLLVAFNSRAVIRGLELGIPTFDTHGILRNAQDESFPSVEALRDFYSPKQATLNEIANGHLLRI